MVTSSRRFTTTLGMVAAFVVKVALWALSNPAVFTALTLKL